MIQTLSDAQNVYIAKLRFVQMWSMKTRSCMSRSSEAAWMKGFIFRRERPSCSISCILVARTKPQTYISCPN